MRFVRSLFVISCLILVSCVVQVSRDDSSPSPRRDGGTADAALDDAGDSDAGDPDAGDPDAGDPDAGDPNAGDSDAGDADAGLFDGGASDAGVEPDAGYAAGLSRTYATPVALDSLNSPAQELHGTMTADGLRICFSSDRAGNGGFDIWCATRPSREVAFGTPANQNALNSQQDDMHPALSADGAELFFSSSRSGSGDLFRSVWIPGNSAYSVPSAVSELNTGSLEQAPQLGADGLVLVFGSTGAGNVGNVDLYLATRATRTSPFGPPINLRALNTSQFEDEPAASFDGMSLAFCATRAGGPHDGGGPFGLWGADWLASSRWSEPYPLEVQGFEKQWPCGPVPLPNGSLLFHARRPNELTGDFDLFMAEPTWGTSVAGPGLPRVFEAEGPDVSHSGGRLEGDGWSANTAQDGASDILWGPYYSELPSGNYTATYRMMIDVRNSETATMVSLNINDTTANSVIARYNVPRKDFVTAGVYQDFNLDFTAVAGHSYEFRVWWNDRAFIRVDKVTIH